MVTASVNTVRAAIDAFKSFMSDVSGRISDDTAYPNKLIYYYLSMYRNQVAYEELQRDVLVKDNSVVQTLICIDMEEIDLVECPCAPASGCTFMRTVTPLPTILGGIPIAVTDVKSTTPYEYVAWNSFSHKVNGRSSIVRSGNYFTIKNIDLKTHLYVYTNNEISPLKVQASAIFQYPLEVLTYPICGRSPKEVCTVMDTEFILEGQLQSRVFEMTRNSLLNLRATGMTDVMNNDQADYRGTNQ